MASNSLICNVQSPSFDEEISKGCKGEDSLVTKENEDKRREDDSSDDKEGRTESLAARRFTRSMRTVVKISKSYRSQVVLRGVIKAKNRFFKLINKAPRKIETLEQEVNEVEIETPICVVESEWQRLSMRPPIFKMSHDIDFSDLAVYIVKTNTVQELAKLFTEDEATTEDSAPGGPPPPPSTAPPPPPTAPSMSSGGPKRGRKMKPIHVKQVHVKPNQKTVWSTLPDIEAELSDLRKLFEDTSSSKTSRLPTFDSQESISRPLSVTEAADVLIMFRQFPK